jgi:hypothetical protein
MVHTASITNKNSRNSFSPSQSHTSPGATAAFTVIPARSHIVPEPSLRPSPHPLHTLFISLPNQLPPTVRQPRLVTHFGRNTSTPWSLYTACRPVPGPVYTSPCSSCVAGRFVLRRPKIQLVLCLYQGDSGSIMRFVIETAITSLLILSIASFSTALSIKARNNPLNIDYDPAPAPEDGPPLSAGALRNPAYLPAEIGGIVGAYVFVISIVGIALIIGRRFRLAAERSKQALAVEMIQPKTQYPAHQYPSPLSPTSGTSQKNFSWPSPQKADRNPYVFPSVNSTQPPQSPGRDPSIDHRVIEQDRQNLHKGLEDLFAHVMAHEEAKAASRAASTTSLPQPPLSPLPMQRQPLPQSSPQRSTKNSEKLRPLAIDTEQSKGQKTQSRTSSLMSSLSRKKGGIRNMQISSPIPTPLSQTFPHGYASDEEPLSPVHYSPPPPPPIPKDQVPYSHSRNNSSNTTNDPSPVSPAQSIDAQLARPMTQQSYKSSQVTVQPILPMTNPLQAQTQKKALMINTDSLRNSPAPSQPPSNNGSTRTLPFRAYDPPAGLSSPSFSQTTKTTVLERKTPALQSPGLRTPWTAGAVPYSPYQPQTPLTPYTPTLVTKQERKMRKKLEGRAPVLEMIKSDEEIWDSAY